MKRPYFGKETCFWDHEIVQIFACGALPFFVHNVILFLNDCVTYIFRSNKILMGIRKRVLRVTNRDWNYVLSMVCAFSRPWQFEMIFNTGIHTRVLAIWQWYPDIVSCKWIVLRFRSRFCFH